MVLGAAHKIRGDARLRVEALLARRVADDLDRADQSNAPRVADERMISVAADRRLHSRPDAAHVTDDATLLVDLQRLEGDRGRHRMRGVGVAMPEDAELITLRKQDVVERVRQEIGRDRLVSGRECLGQRHDVGLEAEGLRAEHVAGAAEPTDHFVDDEQDVVFLQDRLDTIEVGGGRHDHPARPHHGLGEKCGDGVGIFAQDQLLQIASEPGRESFLALARLRTAVVMRAVSVQDARDRQIEILMRKGEAGETRGRDRHAVVCPLPRNDLLLARATQRVVDVPRELDGGVVGLGSGVREKRLAHARRRYADQPLGELGGDRRDFPRKAVIERQLAHLAVRGLGKPPLGKTERCAPQPGHPLEVAPALVVVDVNAFAARNNERSLLLHRSQVRRGVQVEGLVACGRRGLRHRDCSW